MSLPTILPQSQGQYAVTAFSRGEVIHNGDVIEQYPSRIGFHAVFHPKGLNAKFVGPFASREEAYSVGASFGDFSHVIEVA